MDTVNYSDFREKLKTYLDMLYNNHEVIVITRKEVRKTRVFKR